LCVFHPDGLLPLSVQRFGMHNLYQAVIVSVVHRHADQD
jgi:hypothetical protein